MNLTLGRKIILGFGILTAAMVGVGAVGFTAITGLGGALNEVGVVRLPSIVALDEMNVALLTVQSSERALLLVRYDPPLRQASWLRMTAALQQAEESKNVYDALPHTPEEGQIWGRFNPAWERWKQDHAAVEAAARNVERAIAEGMSVQDPQLLVLRNRTYDASMVAKASSKVVEDLLRDVVALNVRVSDKSRQSAEATRATVTQAMTFSIVLGLLMGLGGAWFLGRNIAGILESLLRESAKVTTAVQEGKLGVRADVDAVNFEFRGIVKGMNNTMDAFAAGPVGVAIDYVDRISKGDLPPKITDEYRGDFHALKTNLNSCIDAIRMLVVDSSALAKAAVDGKLKVRADVTRHSGDFARVIGGVNETLDAVVRPIEEAGAVLAVLANRDLRARVKGDYQGDHAQIKESINSMADSLEAALTQVSGTTDQLSAASEQIAASSQTVSQGTTEQASALEETSSTLEEIAAMTRQNADNTQQAKALTQATKVAADSGNLAMAEMVASMRKIRAAAEGTAEIIRDINEIAFQTNLLALNAAVEAARAGDAGRGFAVVAEEVRNLALRSKDAAKKTEELIKESVKLANEGGAISQSVNDNLAGIVTSVGKVTDIVGEIAVASEEQARGIDQVNKAVSGMDRVVQQAAANSEETSSAAAELSSQAQDLAGLVGSFQLSASPAAVRRGPTRKIATPPRLVAPAARRHTLRSHGNGASNGNGHAHRAEDLIPMDQDPDFREF